MKLFNYNFLTKGNNLKILVLSDIHYHKNTHKLKVILKYLSKHQFDMIFLVGDIIDSTKTLNNSDAKKNIINFIDTLSKHAKVYLSFGSHDESNYNKKDLKRTYALNDALNENLKENTQIFYEENKTYELDKFKTLTIINPSFTYAMDRDRTPNIINQEVQKYSYLKNLDKNKYNILLCHYPNFVFHLNKAGLLDNIDLVISGHNHNGMTQLRILPLEKILNLLGNPYRGIITPNKSFKLEETKNLRGFIPLNKRTSLLINPAVTSLGNMTKILQYGDFLFYNGGSIINFNNNQK